MLAGNIHVKMNLPVKVVTGVCCSVYIRLLTTVVTTIPLNGPTNVMARWRMKIYALSTFHRNSLFEYVI